MRDGPFLTVRHICDGYRRSQEVKTVWDIWVVAITAGFFVLAFALVRWFDAI
jgi:hypothetical protein